MSTFAFSPEMRRALDAYTVPPLPEGFAERVVARALAESRQRPPVVVRTSRWRRTGRIVTGAALAGLLTAAAAAAGWLGKPVYVPVISELIERIAPGPGPKPAAVSLPAQAAPLAPAEAAGLEPQVLPAAAPQAARPVEAIEPEIARAEAAPTEVLPPAQVAPTPRIAPNPVERIELRRDVQRQPGEAVAQPPALPAPTPDAAPIRSVVEAVRTSRTADPAPAARETATPREVRPIERVRDPATTPTRIPRQTIPPAERRRELREHRIP